MTEQFFEQPIINSPYEYPARHWELDGSGQPTHQLLESRRRVDFLTPFPKPKRRGKGKTQEIDLGSDLGGDQRYHSGIISGVRQQVDSWRTSDEKNWRVTPETARLLKFWRHHKFSGIRPFFCQVEAVETAIWLTEVAPTVGKAGRNFLEHLDQVNGDANPGLERLALKLATGAGKTTVMAMLIAWQTVNAVRRPTSSRFTRGFLIVAPGLTIKDRLRVLQPNDPDSYYKTRELVPADMLPDLERAKIVITNYHAFKLREKMEISKGGRQLLQGRGEELQTLENNGQMMQRVMPELLGMKNIMVLNDEAHHCYREKPEDESDEEQLKGDARTEAKKNAEAARLWITGIEAINEKIGVSRVMDLSATPFFLSGSGYVEGTLFPWTMSDFSLMDAIECGIVKLPRIPVADNISSEEMPMFRNLWDHIGKKMPKKGRGAGGGLNPDDLPPQLRTALEALYGHYSKTFELWKNEGIAEPPCFIVVCNNTSTSKLIYDYISGYVYENAEGSEEYRAGSLELFRNYDEHGNPLARPNTLLIDSEQLESGDALDNNFRKMASTEIEQFRREIVERTGNAKEAESITDQDLLREVMNTVGKKGRLGETVRCVVSVSMLTEGWDANTVTHVLGVRAFGTQLLCEQVIGRGLRRQSYELNEETGLFNVEYADIFGIPFDFAAEPVISKPQAPRETVSVKAISPERDELEISFPRVQGYRIELPEERLRAEFDEDSVLTIDPTMVGASETRNSGIIGEGVDLNLVHTNQVRKSTVLHHLARELVFTKWLDSDGQPKMHLFHPLKRITKRWLDECVQYKGNTYPAQLMYKTLSATACERITAAITQTMEGDNNIKAMLDPYNPKGSSRYVNFNTSKTDRWETAADRSHINWVILDSGWEGELCRVLESHSKVIAYVKNHSLGLEVPYRYGGNSRIYRPDFIVHINDGHDDPLQLIIEVKGYRREDVKDKSNTMRTYWVPGVNNLKSYGRWAFAEFGDVFEMESNLEQAIEKQFDEMLINVFEGDDSTSSETSGN